MNDERGSVPIDERCKVLIASDMEHEQIFAEIYVDEKFVALVSQEVRGSAMTVEFPGAGMDENLIQRTVELEILKTGLDRAPEELRRETSP